MQSEMIIPGTSFCAIYRYKVRMLQSVKLATITCKYKEVFYSQTFCSLRTFLSVRRTRIVITLASSKRFDPNEQVKKAKEHAALQVQGSTQRKKKTRKKWKAR